MIGCSARTGSDLYAEGIAELRNGNARGAIVLFRNALERDENFVDARYQLARAYAATGKYDQAEKEFQKVRRQNPSLSALNLELARLYNSMNRPDRAIDMARRYLSNQPGSAEALEAMGVAYREKRMYAEAENCLLKALRKAPGNSTVRMELARLYAGQGVTDKATGLLREVVAQEPGNSKASYLLAGIEASRGREEAALDMYRRLSEIRRSDPEAPYRAGLIMVRRGDLKGAAGTADRLIAGFPSRPEGYTLKGIVLYRQRNYREAVATLQNSIAICPSIGGYYFLGLSLYAAGDPESALSQFRRILDADPAFDRARLLTGVILLRQDRLDDAAREMEILLAHDSGNAFAHNVLGNAYLGMGKYAPGMKELSRATELDPQFTDAYVAAMNNLASLYADGFGSTPEALRLAEKAIALAPGNPAVLDTLGYALLRNGRVREALLNLEKAALLLPDNPVVRYHLALARTEAGRKGETVILLKGASHGNRFASTRSGGHDPRHSN